MVDSTPQSAPSPTSPDAAPVLMLSSREKASFLSASLVMFGAFGFTFYRLLSPDQDVSAMWRAEAVTAVLAVLCTAVAMPTILKMRAFAKASAAFRTACLARKISDLPDFTISQELRIVGGGLTSAIRAQQPAILIDDGRRKVCLIESVPNVSLRTLAFRDLLAVEISEDGESLVTTKTSRASQLGGALVGGALFGGLGALVGGLSGTTVSSSRNRVKTVQLRLLVNDTHAPHVTVEFLRKEVFKASLAYSSAINEARHWHGVLEVLIRRGDADAEQSAALPAFSGSFADELRKLADLRSEGILTDEEFQDQKRALLAKKS